MRVIERGEDVLEAECVARAFTHRRRFELGTDCLVITDSIEGPPPVEQFWHFGVNTELLAAGRYRVGSSAELVIPAGAEASNSNPAGARKGMDSGESGCPVLRA